MKKTFEICAFINGMKVNEIYSAARPPFSLEEVLASLSELALIVETVAHIQGMESGLFPIADKARAIIAALQPQQREPA